MIQRRSPALCFRKDYDFQDFWGKMSRINQLQVFVDREKLRPNGRKVCTQINTTAKGILAYSKPVFFHFPPEGAPVNS